MISNVTTTPIARMPPKTATNGPSGPTPWAVSDSESDGLPVWAVVCSESSAVALPDNDDLDSLEIDDADDTDDTDDADDASAATGGPVAADAVAPRSKAARFSPPSTQKRAPVKSGAPHCGQNRTASSGPLRRMVPLLLN